MKNKLKSLLLLNLCIAFLASGCAGSKPALQTNEIPFDFVPAKHLVFIGLDGWGGAYTSRADMPTAKRMMSQGASTLDMRCILPSNSGPNWTALFYGVPPKQHTYLENIPSIFTVVKNSGRRGAPVFFYGWTELDKIIPDETAEKRRIASDLDAAQEIAAHIIQDKPVFTAVVFKEPDSTGHNKRWGSAAYYAKLADMDGYIAVIEQAVKDAGIYDDTVFVLSSDHGGTFWGHGYNITKQRRIPFVVYGRGIKKGSAIPSPASIIDIAPVLAAILGLEAPSEWAGQILPGVF